jgi:uncharacterized protein
VLVDTRRLQDSFNAVDYLEQRKIPFLIAQNCFDGRVEYDLASIRAALAIQPDVPVMRCDARDRASVNSALVAMVERARAPPTTACPRRVIVGSDLTVLLRRRPRG